MKAKHAGAPTAVGVPTRGPVLTRALRVGPATGMAAQVLLIAALAATVRLNGVSLSPAGWLVGVACAVIVNTGLARGLARYRSDRLSPADWVTLGRATLAVGIAALVADSFDHRVPGALLVSLAVVALTLDAVDGWVARRTRTTAMFGAHFDAEVDAFLIFILSVYVARFAGAWVLAIGAARYVFLVAGWLAPWLRRPLPARQWRKVVAATQGVVLTIAAAQVLPPAVTDAALVVALVLLAESFGRDVRWLWGHRHASAMAIDSPPAELRPAGDPPVARPSGDDPSSTPSRRRRARTGIVVAFTVVAVVLVWGALVVPDEPTRLRFAAFLSIPLEGLVLIGLALVLPTRARRILAWVAGPVLALVVILKLLDFGFWTAFDRPFDPYQDASYAKIGSETLRDSIGGPDATLVIVALLALCVAVFIVMTLATRRVTNVAAGHPRWSLRALGALGGVWLLCWVFGADLVSGAPVASTSSAGVVVQQVSALRADLRDPAVFAKEIRHDALRNTPTSQLLTGLRGKDVILAIVESYGQVAVQGSSFSPQVDATLAQGTKQLQASGFSARSGFLTSTTFGGISWLAHSSMQSGLTVNTQRRYDQLIKSNRFTLSDAFDRAGFRTVDDVPSDDRPWAPGTSFYHFDKLYNRLDVGYHGPTFAYASMPDQYVMAALQHYELAKPDRRPVFAEVDLVSSHEPWTNIPSLMAWNKLGNGSIFKTAPSFATTKSALWGNSTAVQAAYGRSIQYTMSALVSFVKHANDPNLVMIAVGDHQPWTEVSGQGSSHNVPISIIAHDPAVLKRVAGWGWSNGLRPSPRAPVWPMSALRNRLLRAFDSPPKTR
jgi:phosphatidylglycerophosphate synthase